MSAGHQLPVVANPAVSEGERPSLEPAGGRRIDLGRLWGVPIMVLLLVGNALPFFEIGSKSGSSLSIIAGFLARLLTIGFYALLVAVFLRRSAAHATTPSRAAAVVAVITSYLPFSIGFLNHGTPGPPTLVVANVLLVVGLSFSLWSLRCLDRSFSIVAQARTVVSRGPYRIVRHPLYTGELTAALGVTLLNPGWATFVLWFTLCGLQAYRAHHEEAILLATLPDYAQYQQETPQLLPIAISRAFPKGKSSPR